MAKFIELHNVNNDGKPVLINTDWVAYIDTLMEHTIIHIGVKSERNGGGSRLYSITVKESYYAIKEMMI